MAELRSNAFGQPNEDRYTAHSIHPYLTGEVLWDTQKGSRGIGPKGYKRSDERLGEDIYEKLTVDRFLDATYIDIEIANVEVTLNGRVASREEKRRAADLVEDIIGVHHVQNNLRIEKAHYSGFWKIDVM